MKVGWDSSSFQGGKRTRSAEDEAFLDNYHTHKRYLSEVMASSFDGLKVGESYSENVRTVSRTFDPIDSAARTETGGLSRSASSFPSNGEELSSLDSPMSDDSDESVGFRVGHYHDTSHHVLTCPVSPASPCKMHRTSPNTGCHPMSGSATTSLPLPCSRSRVADAGSRFPPSPSDPCHSGDLRRAALLRSLQMRAHSPITTYAVSADDGMELGIRNSEEADDQSSPGSLSVSFGETSPEQADPNDGILRSPAHGLFPCQVGRSSSLVRSLLLDECIDTVTQVVPESLTSAFDINFSKSEGSVVDPVKSEKSDHQTIHGGNVIGNGKFTLPLHKNMLEGSENVYIV